MNSMFPLLFFKSQTLLAINLYQPKTKLKDVRVARVLFALALSRLCQFL